MLGRNGIPGRSKTLQVARQRTNEKTGRVAECGKQAHTNSTRELAEWGEVQEMDGHCRTRSDWAVLVTDGTAECNTIRSEDPMVSSEQGVMPVRRCEGKRLQAIHTC